MLSLPEKIIFALAALVTLYLAWRAILRLRSIIFQGEGSINWQWDWSRLVKVGTKILTMQPTFKLRIGASILHLVVALGFLYYMLVNLGDVLAGYIPDFTFLGTGLIGDLYRLGADLLSVGILVGILYFLIRRFVFRPENLTARQDTLLHPKARFGIQRDSLIVGTFVLVHVGARFLGESFKIAEEGWDAWQPFASAVSNLWAVGSGLEVTHHAAFWLALGTIMAFIPYFPYSKHIHLFFAPLSFLTKPERHSIGQLDKIDFEDESLEEFGATSLSDLSWRQLIDPYACIMCYRCQEVCPAYTTGKVLSPAALEINKRYFLNEAGSRFASGKAEEQPLVEWAIPTEAIWACTSCGACVEVCPVNNEPMQDILEIRRSQVLMEDAYPSQLQAAFRGMERAMNPWGVPPNERMKWAKGLEVPTVEENPEAEILWWVGCAPATDARAQKTAVAFAQILNAAGVSFAVLGEAEQCTGDSARRAGREDLFFELAAANVEILNEVAPKRIVTTCPHCLHTLKNEYPAYGGQYEVVHHTQYIMELFRNQRLVLAEGKKAERFAYHDPCYLSRHNGIVDEPRELLGQVVNNLVELPHNRMNTFCCGAGGAQIWKEEEHGTERVADHRFQEAAGKNVDVLALGCPFCLTMMSDAVKDAGSSMVVEDIAEIVAAHLPKKS